MNTEIDQFPTAAPHRSAFLMGEQYPAQPCRVYSEGEAFIFIIRAGSPDKYQDFLSPFTTSPQKKISADESNFLRIYSWSFYHI